MGENRLFWPQEMMDEWIVDEKAVIEDDVLSIVDEKMKYRLCQAVHFIADVGDGDDVHSLIGKVKEVTTLEEMGSEHYMDSVIVEDSAYEVVQGFTGAPIVDQAKANAQNDISKAIKTQAGSETESEDKELLANFLLDNL